MENKKAQLTIWIVVAIAIFAIIAVLFFLKPTILSGGQTTFNLENYIRECIKPFVNEVVGIIMPQGGFLEPKNFKVYNDIKIEYTCKTDTYYEKCINIHPMLIDEITNEIKAYIKPRLENCFVEMKKEAEKKNWKIEEGTTNFDASIVPDKVLLKITKKMTLTKNREVRTIEKFDVEIKSPVYNLAKVAMEITNSERLYCYFEYIGYIAFNPNIDIRKFVMSDFTKIYTITDRESGKIMNIAIRDCILPGRIQK